ncbi:MetQ/NlpA family ABC transporter substrate-binding protein [Paenibacillus jiagnxiensis]|uniref:MetQ/NlpA family ABC transporter substrate-binding protein n=1 Tax=Paenibacillus jiagnxiensis TaxID=3228926 RepID=UPI0033AF5A9B
MKKWLTLIVITGLLSVLAACGGQQADSGNSASGSEPAKKDIKIGATVGPYSDMVTKAIKPIMEKEGYNVEVVEFNDYVQPNKSLANGSIDANLFQHILYLEQFKKDNKLELSALISVPTAPVGIYSNKFKSIDEIPDGSTVTVASDPTNLGRALLLLKAAGLIDVGNLDPATVSEKDITSNPKNLKFEPVEAAQLPRTLDSVDAAVVPGNFALSAGMDLNSALQLENVPENYRNQVVVSTANENADFAKALKAAVESPEFEKVIDSDFQGFSKPEWMQNR